MSIITHVVTENTTFAARKAQSGFKLFSITIATTTDLSKYPLIMQSKPSMLCFHKNGQYHVYVTLDTFRECRSFVISSSFENIRSMEWSFNEDVRMYHLSKFEYLTPAIVRDTMLRDPVTQDLCDTQYKIAHEMIDKLKSISSAPTSILGYKTLSCSQLSGIYTINDRVFSAPQDTKETPNVPDTNSHPSQANVPIELPSVTANSNSQDAIIEQLNTKIKALEQQLASETAQRNYNKHFIARLMEFICQPPTDEERMKATGVIGMMYDKMPIDHKLDLADYLNNMCEYRDSL